jgi:hypothetical protein
VTVLSYLLMKDRGYMGVFTGFWPGENAILIGLVVTAIVWALAAFALRGLAGAERAQLRVYADLRQRAAQLRERLPREEPAEPRERAAWREARAQLDHVDAELTGTGSAPALRWALASGYVNVLRALHRAEEALILVESPEAVVGDALHDDLSLQGSTIGNRERLGAVLRAALHRLAPGASQAFVTQPPGAQVNVDNLEESQALEALREVRFAINEFRDDRQDGLVRARNRLIWAMLAVAAVTYLLLGLVLLKGVDTKYICAAVAFYLVGAIVGLFNRLRLDAKRSSAIEDYGLSQARLFSTPVISGLAAVVGVFLIAAAPELVKTTEASVDLGQVFDLETNPLGLLYAAIFGLAPDSLTSRLQQQAARLERDLQQSEAATTEASPDGGG